MAESVRGKKKIHLREYNSSGSDAESGPDGGDIANTDDCGKCKRRVRDDQNGLQCDLCHTWYHCGCLKISKADYENIMGLKNIVKWFCINCDGTYNSLKRDNDSLRKDNYDLKKENKNLKKLITDIVDRIDKLEKRFQDTHLGSDGLQNLDERIAEHIQENNERERKKSNLIIFGVEESYDREIEGRKAHDMAFCEELITNVLKVETETKMEVVTRLGKPAWNGNERDTERGNVRRRPLLIKFENPRMKWNVISRARELKNVQEEKYKNISIVPDQTPKEREQNRQLRLQLAEKRANNETGWYIKSGKLCHNSNFRSY